MKKFLKFLLTIWLIVLLLALGGNFCFKPLLISGVRSIGQEELQKGLSEIVEEQLKDTTITMEEKEEIVEIIQNNPVLNDMMDRYLDILFDVALGNIEKVDVDWKKEVDTVLIEIDPILKEHNIEIDDNLKEEVLNNLPIEELNQELNQVLTDTKAEMPQDTKVALQGFRFVMGELFLQILIILIILDLVFIALLNKNYFSWLFNFGIATLVVGFLYLSSYVVCQNVLVEGLKEMFGVTFPFDSLLQYGGCLVALGCIAMGLKIFFTKRQNKTEEA